MNWAYCITTVPERDYQYRQTLLSLNHAGFKSPEVYRDNGLRAFGHWWRSALELYIRNPNADVYAIFQDDILAVQNLKEYLDTCEYPQQGYWNLYTHHEYRPLAKGWQVSPQRGLGAQGLVFSNDVLRLLFAQDYFVKWPKSPTHGWRNIDGCIMDTFKLIGYKEYIHNPSLLQHVGDISVIGNRGRHEAPTFPGVEFDAMKLVGANK